MFPGYDIVGVQGQGHRRRQKIIFINNTLAFINNCSVAQRKRVGLITQRSSDRNRVEQLFFFLFIATYVLLAC